MPAELRSELVGAIEDEARNLLEEKLAGIPDSLEGRTIVIEFARGGADGSSMPLPAPFGYQYSFAQLSDAKEMEQAIVRLAGEGKTDEQVAHWLTARGHRSPQSNVVLCSTVRNIRLKHRLLLRPSQSHPCRVPGHLTVPQLATKLEIPRSWIYDRIHNGTIHVEKDAGTKCYLFPDKTDTLREFRQLAAGEISHLDP